MDVTASTSTVERAPSTSVIVVAICSIPQLRLALGAIESQSAVESFEVIVAADPRIGSLDIISRDFPAVAFLSEQNRNTPIALTAMAVHHARGERIVLTEDSCVASPGWLAALIETEWRDRAAVGGAIEPSPGASPSMWAFAYVDFFRYMPPLTEGPYPSLSVCNVAYHASHLRAVEDEWREGFHETNVHEALVRRFGPLWLNPRAIVRVKREVAVGDAIYERYAFGRLFGATRISNAKWQRRIWFSVVSPALPVLLMTRMVAKAARDPGLFRELRRAFPPTLAMVAAWSWGEWLGYVTKALPSRITTAPEISRKVSGKTSP